MTPIKLVRMDWSKEATVVVNGLAISAFQSATFVVRGQFDDGSVRFRVLPPGAALVDPHLATKRDMLTKYQELLRYQTRDVVVEG